VLLACHFAGQFDLLGSWLSVILNQMLIFPYALWANLTAHPESANTLALGQMYTVAFELMFYAVAPFIVRRRLPVLITLFALAAAYHAFIWYIGAPQRTWHYDFFPGSMLYFLTGILAYRVYTVARTWNYPAWLGYGVLPLLIVGGRLILGPDYQ
jgi:hypothetical protein